MRRTLLAVTLIFIVGLAVLTVDAFANGGNVIVGVFAILILILFSIGIVGALRQPPR
jgi:hypothetical protein